MYELDICCRPQEDDRGYLGTSPCGSMKYPLGAESVGTPGKHTLTRERESARHCENRGFTNARAGTSAATMGHCFSVKCLSRSKQDEEAFGDLRVLARLASWRRFV